MHKLFEIRAPLRLREHVHARAETPLFTDAEVEEFRSIFADFLEANTARKVDWSIQPFQPYTLKALQQEDPDTDLFACLQEGAPTGFFKDIPRSGIFVPVQADATDSEQPLILCDENWKGARDNPETLAALVQEELANGWLEEVLLEEARTRWKDIAIGKMNVVIVLDKNPRLTVDETVSGVNPGCMIPERYNLPGLGDLQAGYPLRGRQTEISSFSLDIKAAHKSLLMRERDRGLAGVTSGADFLLSGHAFQHELLGVLVAEVVGLFRSHVAPSTVLGTLLIDVCRRFDPGDVYRRLGHIGLPGTSLLSFIWHQDFMAETSAGLRHPVDRLATLLQSGHGTSP